MGEILYYTPIAKTLKYATFTLINRLVKSILVGMKHFGIFLTNQ